MAAVHPASAAKRDRGVMAPIFSSSLHQDGAYEIVLPTFRVCLPTPPNLETPSGMLPKVCLPGPTMSRFYQIGCQDQPSQMLSHMVSRDRDVQNSFFFFSYLIGQIF